VLKEGAEAIAKEGAEALVKTGAKSAAKTGTKAIPIVGNIMSFGSACLAGAGLVKELFAKPRDGEKIAKAGLNTLAQTVGVAFPWVGLAGDMVDMAWSAKIGVSDAQKGVVTQGPSNKEVAQMASEPARLLADVLDGVGQGSLAKTFRDLADATDTVGDTKKLAKMQLGAMSQFAQM